MRFGCRNARPGGDHFRRGEGAPVAEHVNRGLRQKIAAIAKTAMKSCQSSSGSPPVKPIDRVCLSTNGSACRISCKIQESSTSLRRLRAHQAIVVASLGHQERVMRGRATIERAESLAARMKSQNIAIAR